MGPINYYATVGGQQNLNYVYICYLLVLKYPRVPKNMYEKNYVKKTNIDYLRLT